MPVTIRHTSSPSGDEQDALPCSRTSSSQPLACCASQMTASRSLSAFAECMPMDLHHHQEPLLDAKNSRHTPHISGITQTFCHATAGTGCPQQHPQLLVHGGYEGWLDRCLHESPRGACCLSFHLIQAALCHRC